MIALGSDHGGFELKEHISRYLTESKIPFEDFGTYTSESCDYPDIAKVACDAVVSKKCENAILICGTGIGISIAANKRNGIRAACCSDYFSAKYTRLHNDANVLCLGGRVIGVGLAIELVNVFLNTKFEGNHHTKRVEKIAKLESE